MTIEGLTLIGETINASIPSTEALFEANDIDGIRKLARMQDDRGAAYVDVNVGDRSPEFMAEVVKTVQSATTKPLSIDTPDPAKAEAGLRAYNQDRADGNLPILNSISPLRLELLELYALQPFMPILLVSERAEEGQACPNRTGKEIYETATEMAQAVRNVVRGFPNEQCIFDPGIASIGSDTEGLIRAVLDGLKRIKEDADLAGVHASVGLSNFTIMLPSRCADGSPVKSPLESAFLTKAISLGLDTIIGSVKRKYRLLSPTHPAMQCLEEVLRLDGFDCLKRVMEFYS